MYEKTRNEKNVKREMRMQNSVKLIAELFTFKLQNFRNKVNDLRENYWLIFSSNFNIIPSNPKYFIQVSTSLMYDDTNTS